MSPEEAQYKVKLSIETQRALVDMADFLGYHSSNALSANALTVISKIPPHKFHEAMGMLTARYVPSEKKGAKK